MSDEKEIKPTPEAEATEAKAPAAKEAEAVEAKAEAPEAPNEAPAAEAEEAAPTPVGGRKRKKSSGDSDRIHGLGRRKTAVARVSLREGQGQWKINGRPLEDYFPRPTLQQAVQRPLVLTERDGQYDVHIRVAGGGMHGQADAVRLGLSRALVKIDEGYRPVLRSEGLMTRDAREVERKKPGRPKARKRFQFSKR